MTSINEMNAEAKKTGENLKEKNVELTNETQSLKNAETLIKEAQSKVEFEDALAAVTTSANKSMNEAKTVLGKISETYNNEIGERRKKLDENIATITNSVNVLNDLRRNLNSLNSEATSKVVGTADAANEQINVAQNNAQEHAKLIDQHIDELKKTVQEINDIWS